MSGTTLAVADLGCQNPGSSTLQLRNVEDRPARVVLLGGIPFTEELVMWWNFVGRSHDEIVSYRHLWQDADERFGAVEG
jgi:quercetin 2,3-dioxygenase